MSGTEHRFSETERAAVYRAIAERRDMRHFRPDPVEPAALVIPAVRNGHVYEIKSCDILQPGPAALTDGVRQLHALIQRWAQGQI
jgi:hypothetical protein